MRMVGTVILGIALAYTAFAGTLYLIQERMVFFPELPGRALSATPAAVGLPFEETNLEARDGVSIHGWFVPAPAPRGAVLICHGNAGNIAHRLEYLLMFRRLGYSTLIFDYRGYGRSGGSPTEQGTYLDAEAAWEHLTRVRGFPPQRIAIFGESLGGAVGAWLAVQHPPGALVLASTFTSVPDLGAEVYPFLPVRLLARIHYDARQSVAQLRTPILVAHSPQDDIVPFAHGRALYDAASGPRQFLELSGGHNDGFVFARETWIREVGAFLDRYIASAGAEGHG